jgi:hypothetical protein
MIAMAQTSTWTTAWLSQTKRAMKRVLFATLLCCLGPTQASAQNEISQQLLELDEDQRNVSLHTHAVGQQSEVRSSHPNGF